MTEKGWCIFGRRGGGKSWLTKHILDSTPDHLIYDPLDEHPGYRRYIPDDRRSVQELETVVRDLVIPEKFRPSLFVIDEANRYIRPKPNPLPGGVDDLNDFLRHYGMSVGYVCRRPVQFHTDIVELSNYLFFFGLSGKNDYAYMEDLHHGLGDAVRDLSKYEFISLEDGQTVTLHAPIDTPEHEHHT